jgi:Ca-activated chloride channel family protein
MSFLSPWWLLLLFPVAALAVAHLVQQRRRSRYALRFATLPMLDRLAPQRPGWRRHVPAAALLLALTALGLAAARPELAVRVPHERATVIVAVDVSRSMQATDVAPNRIDAARQAAAAFIDQLPDTFNVGVVTFAGTTSVLAPASTDHAEVVARLDGLRLADRTAIGEAVFTALDQVAAQAARSGTDRVPARIVLLSDGSNTAGREPTVAAEVARRAGVPVATIAYGTAEGTIMENGRPVAVPVDERTLSRLAEATGAASYTAQSGDELSEVYADIGSSIGWRTEPREITPYLAAFALLAGVAAGGTSLLWFARIP